jgi:signal transduction histidine kinase
MVAKDPTKTQLVQEIEKLQKENEILSSKSIEQNITERILLENKDWTFNIIQQMPFPIEISASDGTTTLVNEAFLRVFDFEKMDDVIGKYNVFNDPFYSSMIEDIKSVYNEKKVFTTEIKKVINTKKNPIYTPLSDGNVVLEVTMFPLISAFGEVRRIVKIWKDVTGHSRAEELLKNGKALLEETVKKRSEELNNSNKAKDKFFSLISHDLKSPFNGMIGITNILLDDFDELSKEEIKPFIENYHSATLRIYNLIESLLEWSNLTLKRTICKPKTFDLYEEIVYSLVLLKQESEKYNIKITNLTAENFYSYADPDMARLVLSKLIHNAIRFNKPNGEIIISGSSNGKYAEVIIKDTGVGIGEQNMEDIFRIDVNTKTPGMDNESGSGLGLIICKEIIEKNNGKLSLESDLGIGTTVKFMLPASNKLKID